MGLSVHEPERGDRLCEGTGVAEVSRAGQGRSRSHGDLHTPRCHGFATRHNAQCCDSWEGAAVITPSPK